MVRMNEWMNEIVLNNKVNNKIDEMKWNEIKEI